jgi:hypothetical protein
MDSTFHSHRESGFKNPTILSIAFEVEVWRSQRYMKSKIYEVEDWRNRRYMKSKIEEVEDWRSRRLKI